MDVVWPLKQRWIRTGSGYIIAGCARIETNTNARGFSSKRKQ